MRMSTNLNFNIDHVLANRLAERHMNQTMADTLYAARVQPYSHQTNASKNPYPFLVFQLRRPAVLVDVAFEIWRPIL